MMEPRPDHPGDIVPTPAPVPVSNGIVRTHLAILALAAFAYCVLCYCIFRGLLANFGASTGTVVKSAIATAAMGGFIVWLVPLADLPEILLGHAIPQRRARRGRCPACNYDLQGRRESRCPECGHDGGVPGTWHLTWRPVKRFLLVMLAGLALGVLVGEAWTSADERKFIEESDALRNRRDASLATLGPFDERLIVVRTDRDAAGSPLAAHSGFAWLVRDGASPEPASSVRSESAILGGAVPLFGTGGRERVEDVRLVWNWNDSGDAESYACHLDLRYLTVTGAFVLRIGSIVIRGQVLDDASAVRPPGFEDATVVASDDVLVRRTRASKQGSFEVSVDLQIAEWQRPRAWPATFASLQFTPETGIEAIDPFHSPRVADWAPRGR